MHVVQIVKTETDWSATIDNNGQRLTLTYAKRPDKATVLAVRASDLFWEETCHA